MPRKQRSQPVTLIVVPHSKRAPISLRLPTWLLPLCLGVFIAISTCVGLLAVRSYSLRQEVRELHRDRQMQLAREREMRNTILAQQEEVRGLSLLVEGFQSELASVSVLSSEVRDLLGLPESGSVPTVAPESYSLLAYDSTLDGLRQSQNQEDGMGGRTSDLRSDRSMAVAVEKGQDVVGMQVTLPSTLRELLRLREEVLERMERIEPEKRATFDDLERQMRLLAAAPHQWPTETRRVSSRFGYRTLLGKLEFHKGIDLVVWYDEIRATKDGVVTVAGWQSSYGWTVELQHEMGFATVYGHNSQLLVDQGDEVKAGDVIAISGNSGLTTGPHLHYEMSLNDTPVDPLKYLDADQLLIVTN